MARSFVEPLLFVWQMIDEQSNGGSEVETVARNESEHIRDLCNCKQFKTSDSVRKHNKKFQGKKSQVVIDVAALPNGLCTM